MSTDGVGAVPIVAVGLSGVKVKATALTFDEAVGLDELASVTADDVAVLSLSYDKNVEFIDNFERN